MVIFVIFLGWDWGTPAILQENPNKVTVLYGCGFGFKKLVRQVHQKIHLIAISKVLKFGKYGWRGAHCLLGNA